MRETLGDSECAKPWLKAAGQLKHLSFDIKRINARIEEEFEDVEREDRECRIVRLTS